MNEGRQTVHCCRAYVSDRVQGVGFRMATRAEARRLDLRGYAANLADGRVEVVACGSPEAVSGMLSWLEEGPPPARVDDVSESTPGTEELSSLPQGFEIR